MIEIRLIKLSEVEFDEDIYPRERMSGKAVEDYLEKLKAGIEFPPIVAQEIKYEKEEFEEKFGKRKKKEEDEDFINIISLDGKHRIEAYKQYNKWVDKENKKVESEATQLKKIERIEVEFWQEETLDKKENLECLRIESTRRNLQHGHRLGENDLEFQALRITKDRSIDKLKGIIKELAKEFELTEGRMSQMIGHEVNRKKQSRNSFIYGLTRLGWTQPEIGKVAGLKQQAISEITKNFNAKLFGNEYEAGLEPEVIASNHSLREPVLWHILLQGKTDLERFNLFGKEGYSNHQPKIPDVWNFVKGDLRLGVEYEGRLWCQGVMNILYHYSKQGDLVIDPMAGGGVVLDTCLIMNRKCRAYDIDPSKSGRKDIVRSDIRDGYPDRCKNCDLIILDPPYYKKKEEEYPCPEFVKDRKTFLLNMEKLAGDSFEILKKGGYLALLYGQWLNYEDELKSILTDHLYELFVKAGFERIADFFSPFVFHVQYDDHDTDKAKEKHPWQSLPISRNWRIFKKT